MKKGLMTFWLIVLLIVTISAMAFKDRLDGTSGTFSFLSFIAVLITIYIQLRTLKNTTDGLKFQKKSFNEEKSRNIQPVIVFSDNEGGTWKIENAGKGTALNVLIFYKTMKAKDFAWDDVVVAPAYPARFSEDLTWITHPHTLVAVYEDIEGNCYTTESSGNRNKIMPDIEKYKYIKEKKANGIWKKRLDCKNQNKK